MSATQSITPGFEHTALYSYFSANMHIKDVVAELIDNSFDANANHVEVYVDEGGLGVLDDGHGIEDITRLFRIGSSGQASNPTAIGQFGVGAKHALLCVGSVTDVCTKKGNQYFEARADWMNMANNGFSTIKPVVTDTPERLRKVNARAMQWHTTRVAVTHPHKGKGRIIPRVDTFLKDMAIRYRPALLAGKKIMMHLYGKSYDLDNHHATKPKVSTELKQEIVVEGKAARVYAAIADEKIPGLTGCTLIAYGPRIIETPRMLHNQALDNQMFIYVELSPHWRQSLSTHKDKVKSHREELMEAIWEVVEPLAETVRQMKRDYKMEIMLDNLAQDLTEAFRGFEEDGDWAIEPEGKKDRNEKGKGTGGKKRPVGTRKEGAKKAKRIKKTKSINVEFTIKTSDSNDMYGTTAVSSAVTESTAVIIVKINTDNQTVQEVFENKGYGLHLMCADALAFHFLSESGIRDGRKLFGDTLPNGELSDSERYGQFCAMLLERIRAPKEVHDADVSI